MSDTVLVALLTGIFGVLGSAVAAVASILARNEARVIRREVKNDHGRNMREEADERHEENAGKLDQIITRLDELEGKDEQHDERFNEIERTWPRFQARSRFEPPPRHRRPVDDQ